MPESAALLQDFKFHGHIAKPAVNIDELNHSYKIKVIIPGAKKEDIFINIDKNILSIAVLQKDSDSSNKHLKHEFNPDNFERHIALPSNADSIFVNAEYNAGILSIYIPKSNNPVKNLKARIVVY